MAEDLLDTIGQLFGPVRGGLAYAVDLRRRAARGDHRRRRRLGHLDGPDLAADHAALRLRPAPRDRRHRRLRHAGADHPAVAGADRLADQLGRSVGDMYEGAFIPGLVLTGLYVRLRRCWCRIVRPQWAPALPLEARTLREPERHAAASRSLVVAGRRRRRGDRVSGTLLTGMPDATPTIAGAVHRVGVGVAYRRRGRRPGH